MKVGKVEVLQLHVEVLIDDLPDIANRVSEKVFVMVPRDLSMGFLQHVEEVERLIG